MQVEKVEKWIEALESGIFKKTEGTLKDSEGGYCCLGVLCHIFKDEIEANTGEQIIETDGGDGEYPLAIQYRLEDSVHNFYDDVGLTEKVSNYFNLGDSTLRNLMDANDASEKSNFSEVIPVIRQELLQKTEEGKSE